MTVNGGDIDGSTGHSLANCHRDLHKKVVPLPFQKGMRFEVYDQVEVTGLAAVLARLAFSPYPDF